MRRATCKFCGLPIFWAVREGRAVPLDLRPAIYRVEAADEGEPELVPLESVAANHLAICPALHPSRAT